MRRRLAVPASVLALCGAAAALPAAAGAAGNPYTPTQVCGAGYGVVDQHALTTDAGITLGTTYLLYNGAKGKNCAVTLKARQLGVATNTGVSVKRQGAEAPWVTDVSSYRYYAGPVYVKAPGKCVQWGGNMSFPNGRSAVFVAPLGHCG